MKKKNICRLFILVLILSLPVTFTIKGQPPSPPGDHGLNGNQGAGGFAPVDGGSLLLLIGGIGYGGYKWIRKKRL
jgi:hypothetical protein